MTRDRVVYGARARSSFWAEKGKSIIDEKYASLSGIDEVYSVLGISESHFRDSFEAAFGISPKVYLEAVQIEKAKELLFDTSLKVYEVSEKVGFKHRWAFQRTFKKLTGLYPSKYRRTKTRTAP